PCAPVPKVVGVPGRRPVRAGTESCGGSGATARARRYRKLWGFRGDSPCAPVPKVVGGSGATTRARRYRTLWACRGARPPGLVSRAHGEGGRRPPSSISRPGSGGRIRTFAKGSKGPRPAWLDDPGMVLSPQILPGARRLSGADGRHDRRSPAVRG